MGEACRRRCRFGEFETGKPFARNWTSSRFLPTADTDAEQAKIPNSSPRKGG